MKGIILAGGSGTRLYPLSQVVSKQLQAVYDKPMIYYPISMLILMGIREILIISTPKDTPHFKNLLGDGSRFGVSFEYCIQNEPKGIAQAFILGKDFIGKDNVTLILGDNIFYGKLNIFRSAFEDFRSGAVVFGYYVEDPKRYGVIEFDKDDMAISIEEKPKIPKSNYAIPGFYIFDSNVVGISESLKPSARGEYEITDVNREYMKRKELKIEKLGRGVAWLDTGTSKSLMEAAIFIEILEKRQGLKLGCPEEAAFDMGFLSKEELLNVVSKMPKCQYSDYVRNCALQKYGSK